MSETIQIRRYKTGVWEELKRNAQADGHQAYYPTHVLIKNKEIVGYFSLGRIPMLLSWQDSKKMGAMDSVKEIGFIEGTAQQAEAIVIPCDPDSPYMKFLPKMGYIQYTKPAILWIKETQ